MFKEELIIIRHARSKHNVRKSENLDDFLSEFGEKQAKNVGTYFQHEVDLSGYNFYTSPFLRCLQTAREISSRTGHAPIVEPGLREYLNHTGREAWVPNRQSLFPEMDWRLYPADGETYDQEFNETFLIRMHDIYNRLGNKSIVVTHGLPALTLLHIASDPGIHSVPVWDHSIDNCSISIIRRGRVIWHGRNLYHEFDYDAKFYYADLHGVQKSK